MNRDILYYQNRINLLLSRKGSENSRIVNKLRRKIRLLENA
jgi:hypothetical protein